MLNMASSKSKLSLREDLTCAICYELFKDPVMLDCMHHFCRTCITSYWRTVRSPVSCPQCRKEFPSKRFHTNYLVSGLVEKVRASSSAGSVKYLEVSLLFSHVCIVKSERCVKGPALRSCFHFYPLLFALKESLGQFKLEKRSTRMIRRCQYYMTIKFCILVDVALFPLFGDIKEPVKPHGFFYFTNHKTWSRDVDFQILYWSERPKNGI